MHFFGLPFGIIIIFCELYFAFGIRNSLCNDAAASIGDCTSEAGLLLDRSGTFILESQDYFTGCTISLITTLSECYENVTDSCPVYRGDGPQLMDKTTYKSFLIGTCVNQYVFEEGLFCIGNKLPDMTTYINQNCLSSQFYYETIWDAYIEMGDWNWQRFCSLVIQGIECSVNKTTEYGCSDEFRDFLIHSSYVRLPIECRELNSTTLKWLDIYQEIPDSLPEPPVTNSSNVYSYIGACFITISSLLLVFIAKYTSD